MPKITNKVTGKSKTVTDEELKAIQGNNVTAPLYTYEKSEEPAEVTDLKKEVASDAAKAATKGGK
jgi:hypothetical protein